MVLKTRNIKVKKVSNEISLSTAQYSVSYKQKKETVENTRKSSYEIISALKDNSDLLIEMDSSLFFLPEKNRAGFIRDYMKKFKALELDYRYYNAPANSNSLKGFLMGDKTTERHQLLLYLPHEIWLTEEFRSILPIHGIRYYIIPEQLKPDDLFIKFYQMMDIDKLDYFPLIIFVPGTIPYIGLNSKFFTIDDIKKKLRNKI